MDKCLLGLVAPVVGGVDGEHRRDLLQARCRVHSSRGMAELVELRREPVMRSDALGSAETEPAYQHRRGR